MDVLHDSCVPCHRDGGGAPFPLETYEQALAFRDLVRDAVADGRMPPWYADPDVGEWANDRSLTDEERATLLAWLDQGGPEGESAGEPEPRTWPEGWHIGEPTAVVHLESAIDIPATGVLPYLYVYLKTDFPEDRWIQAMEIRPTAPGVVHHILVVEEEPIPGLDPTTVGRAGHVGFGDGLGGFFAVTGPGHQGVVYPLGQAKLLRKGATLKFQLHYTPNGTATVDQTQLGFVFAEGPPEYRLETGAVVSTSFVIPPGADNHEVTAVHRFEESVLLTGFLPHMHLRGKAFRFEVHYADGRRVPVLDVPRFNFHWQEEYILKTPLEVPAGSWLRATGWFDNSPRNPMNPDPTATVRFGEQTYEEMMNGFFHYLVPNPDHPGNRSPAESASP